MEKINFPAIKAIAFDRDGTLNDMTDLYYVLKPEEVRLFDDVPPALAKLRAAGILPYVFTQQNGIGKGLLTEEALADIHDTFQRHLGAEARIEHFFHAPTNDPPLGKPHAGLLREVLAHANCEPHELLAVGDAVRDYECAQNAGVPFAFLRGPKEGETRPEGVPCFEDMAALMLEIL